MSYFRVCSFFLSPISASSDGGDFFAQNITPSARNKRRDSSSYPSTILLRLSFDAEHCPSFVYIFCVYHHYIFEDSMSTSLRCLLDVEVEIPPPAVVVS